MLKGKNQMSLTEQMIEIPAEHEANVFGQFDAYVKKLERTFHVTLIARDGKIKIVGEQAAAEKVFRILTQLVELSRRGNTITEQKRTNDKKLELVHTYIHQTMAAYTSQENLQRLCAYISDFFQDKTAIDIIPIKVDSKLKAIDVMHLGWNIGKALGKR